MPGPLLFRLLAAGGEAVQNAALGSKAGLRVQQSFCVKPNSALSENLQNPGGWNFAWKLKRGGGAYSRLKKKIGWVTKA